MRLFVIPLLLVSLVVSCSDSASSVEDDRDESAASSSSTDNHSSSSSKEEKSNSDSLGVPMLSSGVKIDSSLSRPQSSSSSETSDPMSSSSSDSSDAEEMADLGTCAPVENPISRGDSTSWKFSFNNANSAGIGSKDILKSKFFWNFGVEAIPSKESAVGKLNTSAVTYVMSGVENASVEIFLNGKLWKKQCAPLQVNGSPITGCKCTSSAATVDVAKGGVATWSVTGCSSEEAIASYSWTGISGDGESASYTFSEKGMTVKPGVTVTNDDKSVDVVECDEVMSYDSSSPDYAIAEPLDHVDLPAGLSVVMMGGSGDLSMCQIECMAQEVLTVSLGTGDTLISNYVVLGLIDVEGCKGPLEITLSAPATCTASWSKD